MQRITTCKDCRFWAANKSDNGMGVCTGQQGSGVVEFNVGSVGIAAEDSMEILTPSWWYCPIPNTKPQEAPVA